jgi:hypothetical protein
MNNTDLAMLILFMGAVNNHDQEATPALSQATVDRVIRDGINDGDEDWTLTYDND